VQHPVPGGDIPVAHGDIPEIYAACKTRVSPSIQSDGDHCVYGRSQVNERSREIQVLPKAEMAPGYEEK
jgi:hypothetical protein